MGEIVTITTKPPEIFDDVVFLILIDVMNDEDANICYLAIRADRGDIISEHDVSIYGFASAPVEMILSE